MAAYTPETPSRRGAGLLGGLGLPALLLAALWLPLWLSPDPPLYDYPAHLLEARVALSYADPGLGYAEGYLLRPDWHLESNALATLATMGLARLTPLELAGRLALGLVLALFLFGLRALLRRGGGEWPLLLLAPLLAYNFTFTSGWVNFALATGLALCALATFRDWAAGGGPGRLAWLALLLLLIYSAHLVVWALLIVVLAVEQAAGPSAAGRRRLAPLFAASCAALPPILLTRPILAVALLAGPLAWLGAALLRRLRLRPGQLALAALNGALLAFAACLALEPLIQRLDPEIDFIPFARASFLARTFTLPHQSAPLDPLLTGANLAIVALLGLLVALLAVAAARTGDAPTWRRLAPVGALALLYGAVPSQAADIAVVEPRLVLLALLLCLGAARVPAAGRLRRAIVGVAAAAGLLGAVATASYATAYAPVAEAWRAQLQQLAPARVVLVLRPQTTAPRSPRRLVDTFYDGSYFSATAAIERGGATSRVFGNGPFSLRPELERTISLWAPPAADDEACAETRAGYDAVLGWGALEPQVVAALDACYGPGRRLPDMTIWR